MLKPKQYEKLVRAMTRRVDDFEWRHPDSPVVEADIGHGVRIIIGWVYSPGERLPRLYYMDARVADAPQIGLTNRWPEGSDLARLHGVAYALADTMDKALQGEVPSRISKALGVKL